MSYIQIGVTALRDPITGKMLPAVPLYVSQKDAARGGIGGTEEEIAGNLAGELRAGFRNNIREYVAACEAAGVPI